MRQVFDGVVAFDDNRILTRNLAPGQRVYDEELHTVDGVEYRTWNPMRSKLGSFILKGGRNFPLRADSRVLYLGAANGTTPSHVSDIVAKGVLVAVEFSPRSFRDLLRVSDPRPNMVPVLADAWRPELYERFVGKVDFLFQDIAQRQQSAIFAKNVNRFKPAWAMIAIKARSVDVAAHPRDVYENVTAEVSGLTGYEAVETVDLGPFEKDHAAVVFRPGGAPGGAPKREVRAERRGPPPDERRGGGGYERRGPPRDDRRGPPRDDRRGPPQRFEKRPYDKRDRPAGFQKRDDRGGGPERRKWK